MNARNNRSTASSSSPYESSIGFSRAVRVGDRIVVSGTAPIWPANEYPDDVEEQTRRCFQIVSDALTQIGGDLADVVRTRLYLISADDSDTVRDVHREIFKDIRPAASIIVVSALLDPRWKVEVEAEAVISG